MYCDNCGQELREGAKFCPKCGTQFVEKAENMVEPEKNDPKAESTYIDNYEYNVSADQNAGFKRRKNGESKKVLFVIIGLLVAAGIFAAVMVFLSMNSGMTPKKAYKKYFKVLQEDRGKVVDFEEKSGANGVAITDINGSGIPDVLYITSSEDNSSDGFYLHTMMDNEKDIEVDADNDLTGAISGKDTFFSTEEENYIYIRSEDGLSRRIFSKDSSGNSSTMIEMLAKRTVDEESGEYVYMILTDSGYLESVDEKEYNKYIDSICGQNVTIIITSLSEEELNKQFPSIEDNISENCDDALSKLKNGDVVSVGEKDNNKSDKTERAETKSSETKAKPTEAMTEEPVVEPTENKKDPDYKSAYKVYLDELENDKSRIASFETNDSKGTVMFADVIGDSIPEMLYAFEEPIGSYQYYFRIVTFDGEKAVVSYESTWYMNIQAGILECGLYKQADSDSLFMYRYNQKGLNEHQENILYELIPNSDISFTETELTRHESFESIMEQTRDDWYYIGENEVDEDAYNEAMDEYFSRHSEVLVATYFFVRNHGAALGNEEKNLTYKFDEAVNYLNEHIETI